MRGYKRFRAGAWRLVVDGVPDPITGQRRQVNRTVHAPDNKRGAAQADTELARLVTDCDAQRILPSSGVTVGVLMVRWVEYRRVSWEQRSPGQPDETLRRIHNHVTPHIGDIPLDRLQPIHLTELYNTLRAKTRKLNGETVLLAESTVRRVHDIIHSALEWAVQHDLVARNRADQVEKPGKSKPNPKVPDPAALGRLLAGADQRLALWLRVAAITGARRGQVCALRWSHINPDRSTILWASALAIVKGGVAEKGTKTDNVWPVAIDARTLTMLRDEHRRARERALAVGAALSDDAYVFARDPAGLVPWRPEYPTKRVKKLTTDLDITVLVKQLRNWMATELLGDGEDPSVVANRGGWSNNTTPLNHYAAFVPARDQAAAKKLANRLDGKRPRKRSAG